LRRHTDDLPDTLGDTGVAWPIFRQFVAHDIKSTGPVCAPTRNRPNCAMLAAHNWTLNASTATDRPAIRSNDTHLPSTRSVKHAHNGVRKSTGNCRGPLIKLPPITGDCETEDYHSLAMRDLRREQGLGLPSGEAVARHIGVIPNAHANLPFLIAIGMRF